MKQVRQKQISYDIVYMCDLKKCTNELTYEIKIVIDVENRSHFFLYYSIIIKFRLLYISVFVKVQAFCQSHFLHMLILISKQILYTFI